MLAFYLESVFVGVWIFGWDRLPKKAHLASIWLVAIGSNLSAFWILVANSWMNAPGGDWLELVVVEKDDDSADDWIADRAGLGDIVITGDFPLAARCLDNTDAAPGCGGIRRAAGLRIDAGFKKGIDDPEAVFEAVGAFHDLRHRYHKRVEAGHV